MSLAREPGAVRSEINVTPLVDVVLVLLIIFMVVIPILQSGYAVTTPPVSTSAKQPRGQLIVRIDRAGRTYLNHEQVPIGRLVARLREAVGDGRQPVFLAANGELSYGQVAALMDLCRQGGAEKLAIVFDDLEPPG